MKPSVVPVVLTGTGTDVGKTYIGSMLLRLLTESGVRCAGFKPIETGYAAESHSDAEALAKAAGHSRIRPFFTAPEPISPHRAARQLNRELAPEQIREWLAQHRSSAPSTLPLVETAGGLFSPISQRFCMLDVVAALEPCCFLLVAEDRLGALHDVMATVRAAAVSHRGPDAVVLNRRDPSAATLDNAAELANLGIDLPVFTCSNDTDGAEVTRWLLRRTDRGAT